MSNIALSLLKIVFWILFFLRPLSNPNAEITSKTPHYFIITPNVIKIDQPHKVLIKIFNVEPSEFISIKYTLQDYSNQQNILLTDTVYINPGNFHEINFTIWTEQIIRDLRNSINFNPEESFASILELGKTPLVLLTISSSSIELNFKEKFWIPIDLRLGNHFIITDKILYTPSEQVKVRILNLDDVLKSSSAPVRIDIKNPDGIIVKRFDNLKNKSGIIQVTLGLPPNPKLGKWEVIAFNGKNFFNSMSTQFEVKPYNLPSFTVDVGVSHSVIYSEDDIEITVSAFHSFGIPIKGTVYIKVGVKMAIMDTVQLRFTKTKELEQGKAVFVIEKKNWQPNFPDGQHLYVEALVTEKSSGTKETKINALSRFSVQEFRIDIASSKLKFRPGVSYYITGKIHRSRDNTTVPYIPLGASSFFTTKTGAVKLLFRTGRNSTHTSYDGTFNIKIDIPSSEHLQSVIINIYTSIPSRKPNRQARKTIVLTPQESYNKIYLKIAPSSYLFVGDTFQPTFLTQENNAVMPKPLHYLIVYRGQIYEHGIIKADPKYRLNVLITDKMIPNFRILAYFLVQNDHNDLTDLIADSASFNVQRTCHNNIRLSISNSMDLKPAEDIMLKAEGVPNSYLAFLALDKTVIDFDADSKFTTDTVNDYLSQQDLGCSIDDKNMPEFIFYSAGLSIASNFGLRLISRKSLECQSSEVLLKQLSGNGSNRKKKRSISNLVSDFSSVLGNAGPYQCCKLGKTLFEHIENTDCQTTYNFVFKFLPEEDRNSKCESQILKCCNKSQDAKGQRAFNVINQLIPGLELMKTDQMARKLGLERTYFPHSWLFEIHQLNNKGGLIKKVKLPDSITTWILKTIAVSETMPLCVLPEISFRTYKPAHLDIRLPHRIIRGEQILLHATAYNHENIDLEVSIYMYGVDDLCSEAIPGEKSEKKHVVIIAKDSIQVTFPIIPLHVKSYALKVEMTSKPKDEIVDSITKYLTVEPEGIRKIITETYAIDPQGILNATQSNGRFKRSSNEENGFIKDIPIKITEKSIPGTEKCLLQITGNMMDISIINKELNDNAYRINSPRYSGTNLLAKFALTVYIVDNLEISKRLTPDLYKSKSEEMEKSLSELLAFRNYDGSFSAYVGTPSSVWMTALVAKILCKALNYIIIDTEQLTCKAFNWIMNRQKRDGSYTDNTLEFEIQGDEISRNAWLTAFVLIAMEECQKCPYKADRLERAKSKAGAYLARHVTELPNILAPLTYASLLHVRKKPAYLNYTVIRKNAILLIESMKKQATTVETASYALLTFLALGMFDEAKPYFHRLNHQINSNLNIPRFEKIIALQSLSQFVHNITFTTSMTDIQCDLSVDNHPEFYHSLLINNANALISQFLEAPIGDTLSINAHGKGLANLNIEMQYNKPPTDELCQFDIEITTEEISPNSPLHQIKQGFNFESKNTLKSHISKLTMNIKIVVTYLRGSSPSGPVVVDVGLFSGMVPVVETLPIPKTKALDKSSFKVHENIQHIEITDGSIYFYVEKILVGNPFAIDFSVRREYIVGTIQQVPVRVNSYGNIPETCTRFYHPSKGSPLLETYCVGSMCTCFERDCALCYGPTGGSPALSETDLKKKACSLDFAWIVKVISVDSDDQYKHVHLRILKVLKNGIDEVVSGDNRTLITRSKCSCPTFKPNEDFLIMGSHPSKTTITFNYIINDKYYVENMLRGEKISSKAIVRQGHRRLHNFEENYNHLNLCPVAA